MRLHVGNLSYDAAEQDLQDLFASVGSVESVRLIRDQFSGQSSGFGFVEMLNEQEARAACTTLDRKDFQGRRLTVNEANRVGSGSGTKQQLGTLAATPAGSPALQHLMGQARITPRNLAVLSA
jgi:RNA recognition motif-containing protein